MSEQAWECRRWAEIDGEYYESCEVHPYLSWAQASARRWLRRAAQRKGRARCLVVRVAA